MGDGLSTVQRDAGVALVTGASRGLGLELVKGLLARGWTVLGVARELRSTIGLQTQHPQRLGFICGDLRDDRTWAALEAELARRDRGIDLLMNNAGISGTGRQVCDVDTREVADMLNLHCLMPIRCIQVALPYLLREREPAIVNMNSRMGSLTTVAAGEVDHLGVSYSMRIAKAAQNMLSACLAREFSEGSLRVYSVHPGRLMTRMGSPDAHMTAADGAARLLTWLLQTRPRPESGYYEPGEGKLAF